MFVASVVVIPSTPASAQPNCPEGSTSPACSGDPEEPGAHDPVGSLTTVVRQPNGIQVIGEAYDPSNWTSTVTVDITVDGTLVGNVTANQGQSQKFDGVVPARAGSQVCAKVRNIGPGSNKSIGCVTKTIKIDPFGAWESTTREGDKIRVKGWLIDPDTTAAVQVDVYDGKGKFLTSLMADKLRTDVGDANPGYGNYHGFDSVLQENPADGDHHVCLVAINGPAPGWHTDLGCKPYTVRHLPWGALDPVERTGSDLKVAGWAVDDDAKTTPVTVDVYVDGKLVHTAVANQHREAVGRSLPEYGFNHGYDFTVPNGAVIETGKHTVCVKARNLAAGAAADKELGCKEYTIKGPVVAPVLTKFEVTYNTLFVEWAQDPNADWNLTSLRKKTEEWPEPRKSAASAYTSRNYSNLTPDTEYCFRITTTNDRPSEATTERCERTLRESLPMATDLKVISQSDTSLTVQWMDNAEGETDYKFTYAPPESRATEVSLPAGSGTGLMSYTIQGLKPVTDYYITVTPRHPQHYFSVMADTRGMTTGKPIISSFTTNHSQIGVCDPKDVSVSWKVLGATKLDIQQNGRKIGTVTRETPDEWADSLDVGSSEGNVTYTLVAYSPSGQTSTASARIIRIAPYPLVNKVTVTNMGSRMLMAKLYDQYGNWLQDLGNFGPGEVFTTDPPRCQIREVKVFRVYPVPTPTQTPAPTTPPPAPRVELAWNSGLIIGHDDGVSVPSQTN
ncbi:fibronectin type III domain-containing protein [Streptosporangium sp. NPDC002544]|uniref:fibronectin type III domain-containing protein n=1 Tax=Streptosporangium sp. NPDC002544 TaxID=3154538 RepID=UPI00332FF7BF